MTAAEYKQARESIICGGKPLSQKKLSDFLDVAERTIQRRENGSMKIDREAELAIHCVQKWHALDKIFNNPPKH
jgi:DNA-binding XRE family transcriptional regulator